MKPEEFAENSNLLVMLDALLDTRLATLSGLPEETLTKIMETYHERKIDSFEGMPFEEFQQKYQARDKSLLQFAAATPISFFIGEFCKQTVENNLSSPFKLIPIVTINVWPYKLDESEQLAIAAGVRVMTHKLAEVKIINKSYEELTPAYVKNNVSLMVMYDYYLWLEAHSVNENFKKVTCPDIGLLAPALFFKEGGDAMKFAETMVAIERLSSPFINLCLKPISDFSITRLSKQKT